MSLMVRSQFALLVLTSAWFTVAPLPVLASHTPDPTAVTVAGSLQSELGCPGDWQPECAATHLSYEASDDVWQNEFAIPSGSWEYKAALNDSWAENYGANATQDGANISFSLATSTLVKFYYDHDTHWITSSVNSVIVTAPGSYQSELGCPGDWDPACLLAWLQDPDGDGIYQFSTTDIPVGAYEVKATINESWIENYGAGGLPGGANIPFNIVSTGDIATFLYDPTTHVLSVQVQQLVAVPEPSSIALVLIALLAAGRFARRAVS